MLHPLNPDMAPIVFPISVVFIFNLLSSQTFAVLLTIIKVPFRTTTVDYDSKNIIIDTNSSCVSKLTLYLVNFLTSLHTFEISSQSLLIVIEELGNIFMIGFGSFPQFLM